MRHSRCTRARNTEENRSNIGLRESYGVCCGMKIICCTWHFKWSHARRAELSKSWSTGWEDENLLTLSLQAVEVPQNTLHSHVLQHIVHPQRCLLQSLLLLSIPIFFLTLQEIFFTLSWLKEAYKSTIIHFSLPWHWIVKDVFQQCWSYLGR